MGRKRAILLLSVLVAVSVPSPARAQGDISIRIDKHARPSAGGGVVFGVHVTCGPFPGTEEFRESVAGAFQARTGAEAEGALSPDIVCDGVEREHTAALSPIGEEAFARGPAAAGVSVIACNAVGEDQVCDQASATSRIVIVGRTVA